MPWLRRALEQKVFREPAFARVDTLHLPHFFDQEAQRHVHHGAIQRGAADAGGQRDVADLAQQSAGERPERADRALG